MKKEKPRSSKNQGRRKHEDKNAEGVNRAKKKPRPSQDHQDNTNALNETEALLGSGDSVGDPPSSSETNNQDPKPTRPMDQLLDEIDQEITELIADIEDPPEGLFDTGTEATIRGNHNISEVRPSSVVEEVEAHFETEATEEIGKHLSAALTEDIKPEPQVSAEAEIATSPSVEEIIANMDEDAPVVDGAAVEPQTAVESDKKSDLTEEASVLPADEEAGVAETSMPEPLGGASLEEDLAIPTEEIIATMEEDFSAGEMEEPEPEVISRLDSEPVPLEEGLSAGLEEGFSAGEMEEPEPEVISKIDSEPVPLEEGLSAGLGEDFSAGEMEEPEPETGLEEDVESGPSLEDLISEIDSKISQTLHPDQTEGAETSEPASLQSSEHGKYIRFLLDDILMAIPLSSALEVGHRPDITPLPNLPDWILGISNIRGEIVSVLDLKRFFGRSSSGTSRGSRLIIIHNQDLKVGIIVDSIMGIMSLDRTETDVQPNPYRGEEISSFFSGVVASGEKLLNILDVDRLLSYPRMTNF